MISDSLFLLSDGRQTFHIVFCKHASTHRCLGNHTSIAQSLYFDLPDNATIVQILAEQIFLICIHSTMANYSRTLCSNNEFHGKLVMYVHTYISYLSLLILQGVIKNESVHFDLFLFCLYFCAFLCCDIPFFPS